MKRLPLCLLAITLLSGCSNPIVGSSEPNVAANTCMNQIFGMNHTDSAVSAFYEQDGHLYTTIKVANEAGVNIGNKRALVLSYYSQYPDIDPDYEATPVAIKYFLWPPKWGWRNAITGKLHSLHGGDHTAVDARRDELTSILTKTLKDEELDWLSGMLIHALGDSYAHTKNEFGSEQERAYGKRIGHAVPTLLCKSPDKICSPDNTPKYLGYLTALRRVLGSNTLPSAEDTSKICKEGKQSPFGPDIDWSSVEYKDLKDNQPTAKFVHCMNQEVRQLSISEVVSAINEIQTGTCDSQ